jgi:hypothetical protein
MAPTKLTVVKKLNRDQIVRFFRNDLRRIVTTHYVMFEKLLFLEEDLPLELAELFEDVANTYLDISEKISARHGARRSKVK